MEGLRECPRCKSYYVRIVHIQLNNTFKPECDNCQIEGPYFHSEQSAIKWWNTRTTDPLIEEMARALELVRSHGMNAVSVPTGESVADVVDKVRKEYQERKDAK